MFNIFEFEKKYSNELKNIEEWNYLRNYYREAHIGDNIQNNYSKWQEVKNIFYGFKNWFRKYDYIFFSDSGSRKNINNKMYNIYIDYFIENLNKKKSLLVETPVTQHYKNSYTLNITSRRFIDILTLVISKFYNNKISFLEKINKKYNININYKNIVKKFNAQYKIYKFWFTIIKPKYIFLTCYYDKQYIIKAAHDLKIKVIEIQHGLITKNHSAYFGENWLDKKYIPDYLLTFGKVDLNNLKESILFRNCKIYIIGSFYLEYLRNNFIKNQQLNLLISNYKLSIGVSLQWTVETEMVDFINILAKELKDVIFILIPRNYDKKYNNIKKEQNVIFFKDIDCYQIIMHCDYHVTVYSTCAIEAPSLGVQNILINLNGYTEKFMKDSINQKNTIIVNNKKEFIEALKRKKNHKELIKSNESAFVMNYNRNIEKFIQSIRG